MVGISKILISDTYLKSAMKELQYGTHSKCEGTWTFYNVICIYNKYLYVNS